ncbi:unnamed protein product, partial [Rotaria sp. Silwood2]
MPASSNAIAMGDTNACKNQQSSYTLPINDLCQAARNGKSGDLVLETLNESDMHKEDRKSRGSPKTTLSTDLKSLLTASADRSITAVAGG